MLLAIPIIVGTTLLTFIAGAILAAMLDSDLESETGAALFGLSSIVIGIFSGSLIAALRSAGRTVLEPAVGIGLVVVVLNLFLESLPGVLLGWILPFLIGLAGARTGEWLQERRAGSQGATKP